MTVAGNPAGDFLFKLGAGACSVPHRESVNPHKWAAPNTEDMPVDAPYSFASPRQFQEHGAANVLAFGSSRPLPRIPNSPSLLADGRGFLVMPLLDRLACLGAGHLRRRAIFFMER